MNMKISAIGLIVAVLALPGCESMETRTVTHSATLTGSAEVPGPGDPDGSGKGVATIVDATQNVCYELSVSGIAPATAAHIHRGPAGTAGPPVLPLLPPTNGRSEGCAEASRALANEIRSSPSNFYFNVHNAEYPAGAIRGQLHAG